MHMRDSSHTPSQYAIFGYTALAVCLLGLVMLKGLPMMLLFVGVGTIWMLSYHLTIGWYILVALSPLIHWFLYADRYWYLLQDYPQLLGLYAPVVECFAVVLIIAWIVSRIRQYLQGEKITIHLPGLWLFLLFIGSAMLSLLSVSSADLAIGIKYIYRVLLLWYVGYLVLGVHIIQTKKILHTSLLILAVVGLSGAVMGALSFFTGAWQIYAFPRATPFVIPWLNIAPFGTQHIFLAEVITTTIPIWLYMWYKERSQTKKQWYAGISIGMFIIGLSTLSRAAWVTMAIELLLFVWLLRKKIPWRAYSKHGIVGTMLLIPLGVYLGYFLLTSYAASSSTAARVALTEVAWLLFQEHPIVGNGVGSFVPLITESYAFRLDFGDPLDAHGIIQKIGAEQGIIGLITFFIFFGWIAYHIYKKYTQKAYTTESRLLSFVCLFLLLSPFIFQLFNTQYYSSKMWVPIAICIAASFVTKKDTWSPQFTIPPFPKKSITIRTDM